ncbi:MAG: DUF3391 domain-containing protein, partial [Rhodocyclaceae bacterium]|nr:DUF3391 domain-containing protein [Rhodocyclaceae bacterium]
MVSQDSEAQFIDVGELRIGHYVYLDLGWMKHPFALNNFKITSAEQIATIRQLGINRIRFSPEKSELSPPPAPTAKVGAGQTAAAPAEATASLSTLATVEEEGRRERRALLDHQRARLEVCERQFANAGRAYRQAIDAARTQPAMAREFAEQAVGQMVDKLIDQEESAIRLLSEKAGEKASLHAVNVTTISLLLGKALGHDAATLKELGLGALLHDIGKLALPEYLRWKNDDFNHAERLLYEEHVERGREFARAMKLSAAAEEIIAQHHEFADGKGFPRRLAGEAISPLARIVALVNLYDNLCNPCLLYTS